MNGDEDRYGAQVECPLCGELTSLVNLTLFDLVICDICMGEFEIDDY